MGSIEVGDRVTWETGGARFEGVVSRLDEKWCFATSFTSDGEPDQEWQLLRWEVRLKEAAGQPATETGSIARDRTERYRTGRKDMRIWAPDDVDGKRMFAHSLYLPESMGEEPVDFFGPDGGPHDPQIVSERVAALLNAERERGAQAESRRAAAVRRADKIAAERDFLARYRDTLKNDYREVRRQLDQARATEVESLPTGRRIRLTKDAEVGDRVRLTGTPFLGRIVEVFELRVVVRFDPGFQDSHSFDELEYVGEDAGPEHCGEQATMDAGSIEDGPLLRGHDPSHATALIGICAFCKASIVECVCPHGMRGSMTRIKLDAVAEELPDQAPAVEPEETDVESISSDAGGEA